ncbi:MAG TPA: hypothetical protein PLO37_24260 [Candidatus Hydrogenedentes bacterium]|mgnify:CR=1 FL=1|nr:hypothetical protein [Candidatus Hydrogenedentota bacterium]HPG69978.1 hypothetical protein [Candidatus Hydrogenedentota bacterium]
MTEEFLEGHYKDKYGRWQKDRRKGGDRRRKATGEFTDDRERRKVFRRKVDRERYEEESREMIEEALDEFAADHDGHV